MSVETEDVVPRKWKAAAAGAGLVTGIPVVIVLLGVFSVYFGSLSAAGLLIGAFGMVVVPIGALAYLKFDELVASVVLAWGATALVIGMALFVGGLWTA